MGILQYLRIGISFLELDVPDHRVAPIRAVLHRIDLGLPEHLFDGAHRLGGDVGNRFGRGSHRRGPIGWRGVGEPSPM